MNKDVKFDMRPSEFKPVACERVRWLADADFSYMNEFWNMDLETWNGAKEAGFTYCAIIEDNKILSVAAVWKYSEKKWEAAAVNTRKGYENRGLAKQVVSFVTAYILKQEKTPTLTTGEGNEAMRSVAVSLGYRLIESSI